MSSVARLCAEVFVLHFAKFNLHIREATLAICPTCRNLWKCIVSGTFKEYYFNLRQWTTTTWGTDKSQNEPGRLPVVAKVAKAPITKDVSNSSRRTRFCMKSIWCVHTSSFADNILVGLQNCLLKNIYRGVAHLEREHFLIFRCNGTYPCHLSVGG